MIHRKFFLLILMNIWHVKCNIVADNVTTTADVVNNFFTNYNRYSLPQTDNDGPHIVHFTITFQSIFHISEQTSSFTVRYYLKLQWQDKRLQFTPFIENNKTISKIKLPIALFTDKGEGFI